MAQLYYEEDAQLERLHGRRVAIIGYGSQGQRRMMAFVQPKEDLPGAGGA